MEWFGGRRSRSVGRGGVAVLLLGLLLAACSAAPTGSSPPAARSEAPPAVAPPAATSAPSGGAAAAPAAPPVPIRLQLVHSAVAGSQALLGVIQDAGLFARHGLEVELLNSGGRTAMAALLAGELVLIVTSGAEVASATVAGGDPAIVAAAVNTLDTSIWTRDFTEPAELRGKRIGISQLGDSTDFAARYAARRWGLDPASDVQILQVGQPGERLAALQSGAVDATFLQPPLTARARGQGLRKLTEMADLGLDYQHTVAVTTRRRLASDAPTIERFVRAWAEGLYWYQANPEGARAAVGRFMRLEDPEALAETYAHYRRLYARPPYPSLSGLQTVLDELAPAQPAAREVRPEQLVEPRYLDALDAAGQYRAWEAQYPPAP